MSKADPFLVILEFQLARVLDFCLRPKKREIQFFIEIAPHLQTCPRDFFESRPYKYTNINRNTTISAR